MSSIMIDRWSITMNRTILTLLLAFVVCGGVFAQKTAFDYFNSGNANFNMADYDKAIADFTEVIRLYPHDANGYSSRGSAYFKKGDYDKAIADFEAMLKIDPNFTQAKQGIEKKKK